MKIKNFGKDVPTLAHTEKATRYFDGTKCDETEERVFAQTGVGTHDPYYSIGNLRKKRLPSLADLEKR